MNKILLVATLILAGLNSARGESPETTNAATRAPARSLSHEQLQGLESFYQLNFEDGGYADFMWASGADNWNEIAAVIHERHQDAEYSKKIYSVRISEFKNCALAEDVSSALDQAAEGASIDPEKIFAARAPSAFPEARRCLDAYAEQYRLENRYHPGSKSAAFESVVRGAYAALNRAEQSNREGFASALANGFSSIAVGD